MTDCTDYPTPEDTKRFKNNAGSINEFVTSDSDTFADQDGGEHITIEGIDTLAETQRSDIQQRSDTQYSDIQQRSDTQYSDINIRAENQRDQFEATFAAQFAYMRIGNISDYVGQSLPEADKLNAYQYPDDSGNWYGPVQSQTFPIIIPADPSNDNGWVLTSGATQEWVAETVRNPNLLSNHNFLIPSPDDSQPAPSATPTSYPPGYQIFSGVFANETTGISNLTYIDGRVSFIGGDLYFAVPNTGGLEHVTDFVASVADFDGKPRARGVSFALVGDEYRVTVGIDALEDISANPTPLGSVKFEQGSVATGHEVETEKIKVYTFNSVEEMKQFSPPIGSKCKTNGYYAHGDGGGADYLVVSDLGFNGVPNEFSDFSATGGRVISYLPDGSVELRCFGVKDDDSFDSSTAFDEWSSYQLPSGAECSTWSASGKVYFASTGHFTINEKRKSTIWALEVQVASGVDFDVLLNWEDTQSSNSGSIDLKGFHGSSKNNARSWANRAVTHGLMVTEGLSVSMPDQISTTGFKGWGINHQRGFGYNYTDQYGWDNGSGWKDTEGDQSGKSYTSYTREGVQNTQTTTLTLTEDPWWLMQSDMGHGWCVLNGFLHEVQSYDSLTKSLVLRVWTEATTPTSGEVEYIFGGGFILQGSNNASCTISGSLDNTRCGISCAQQSLYGSVIENTQSQFCGIGLQVGTSTKDVFSGGLVGNAYCEANTYDLVVSIADGGFDSFTLSNVSQFTESKCQYRDPFVYRNGIAAAPEDLRNSVFNSGCMIIKGRVRSVITRDDYVSENVHFNTIELPSPASVDSVDYKFYGKPSNRASTEYVFDNLGPSSSSVVRVALPSSASGYTFRGLTSDDQSDYAVSKSDMLAAGFLDGDPIRVIIYMNSDTNYDMTIETIKRLDGNIPI